MDEENPYGQFRSFSTPPSAPREDTYELIRKARELREAGPSATQEPTTYGEIAKDIAGAGGAGIARGLLSIPGIIGDVGQLYERSPAYAAWVQQRVQELRGNAAPGTAMQAYKTAIAPIEARMTPEEQAGREYTIGGVKFPTGQSIVEGAAKKFPQVKYEGKTVPARVVGTVGEFFGGIPATSAVTGATRMALRAPRAAGLAPGLSREVLTTTGAGTTSGILGETFRGTQDEAAARVLGILPGALAGRAAAGRLPGAATERGQRIAGEIVRRTDENVAPSPRFYSEDFIEGVRPTSAQVFGPRMKALEEAVPGAREAAETQSGVSRVALERSAAAIPEEIQPGGVRETYANPMSISSAEAQNLYRAVQEPARLAYEMAWDHPAFTQARYNSQAVGNAIDSAFKEMGTARLSIGNNLTAQIEALRNYKGGQVPFADVQRLKADANAVLRDPSAPPSAITAAKAISTKLDEMMTDTKNVSNIFMKGVTPGEVGPAFENARRMTREYKSTFETPTTKPLSETHGPYHAQAGSAIIEPEVFLSKVFGSPDEALAKYRELQGISGLDVARPASDWIVSKILGGKSFITAEMIANFRKNPGYDALIREIPALEARLDTIASTGRANQIIMSLTDAVQRDPAKLADWIRKNRGDINAYVVDPEARFFIDQVNRSANALKKLPIKNQLPENAAKTLDTLAKGDMFTLLHGRAAGALAGAGAGYGAGAALGMTLPMQIATEALGAAAGAYGSNVVGTGVRSLASRIVYGTTQQDAMAALQRAAVDPNFARFLAQKPSEANAMKLRGFLREIAARGPALGVAAERLPDQSPPPEKTTEEAYRELMEQRRPLTIRPGRATGGAVNLRALANAAKKHVTRSTQDLLNEHDDTVAKALEIANKHI